MREWPLDPPHSSVFPSRPASHFHVLSRTVGNGTGMDDLDRIDGHNHSDMTEITRSSSNFSGVFGIPPGHLHTGKKLCFFLQFPLLLVIRAVDCVAPVVEPGL